MAVHEITVEFHHGEIPPVPLSVMRDLLFDLEGLARDLSVRVENHVDSEGDDPDLSTLTLEVRPHRSGRALTMTLRMETH